MPWWGAAATGQGAGDWRLVEIGLKAQK